MSKSVWQTTARSIYALAAVVVPVTFAVSVSAANGSDLTQIIGGTASCSLDETHDGQDQLMTIQPEACQPYVPTPGQVDEALGSTTVPGTAEPEQPSRLDAASSSRSSGTTVATADTGRPGDQQLFENTVVEPLAAWAGIGNPDAAMADPVMTTVAVGTTTSLVVDALLFQFAYTQRIWHLSKRQLRTLKSVGRAVFRP